MSEPQAFWSTDYNCWFVPVSTELLSEDNLHAEPVRVEIRDGQMWITRLNRDAKDGVDALPSP